MDKNEIVQLTEQYGRNWGLQHTRRLLQLIEQIGQGLDYDREALWIAAHLHDWGAYEPWVQKDVDHALRSRQVAGQFLNERGCPVGQQELILECIELHHQAGDQKRSIESILLRDADALDFLGVVGVLRNFAINPRDLRTGFNEARRRQERSLGILTLEASRALAEERVQAMDALLERFEQETLGYY